MRLPLFVRHALYTAKGGFLVRPLVIAVLLGGAGMTLSWLEERVPMVSAWVPRCYFPRAPIPRSPR